ncbi:MAG TPA: 3-dehydroquinate synthase, partial [Verrucomicrobiales bacterium]|nr:3-dehydroquinate synthase [Verrucomicrobiales bacterium]
TTGWESVQAGDRAPLVSLISRNVAIKAAVVEDDELETKGIRALLNFGHTIGHGIEAAAGYGQLLHGEAISLGMVAALRISETHAGLDPGVTGRVVRILRNLRLPVRLNPAIPQEQILAALARDKKFEEGQIRFVLLRSLGDAFVSNAVPLESVTHAVARLTEEPPA